MRITIVLIGLLLSQTVLGQAIYKKIYSEKLGEERQIKILLPRGYTQKNKQAYPVIYVFDGDYLFEAVAGNVDYYSYWDNIPDAIVVGVNQRKSRDSDCSYNKQNSFPDKEGAAFFEFVGAELLPFIDDTFKTEIFTVAVGHGLTANFINYFLLREGTPLFNGYVAISPDFAPKMPKYLTSSIQSLQSQVFYYMATSDKDVGKIKEKTLNLHKNFQSIENKNFLYSFNKFKSVDHYSLPAHAIPSALEKIFFIFGPISKEEYENSILKLKTSPVEYLKEKYEMIEKLFGLKKEIITNDIKAIDAAIAKKEKPSYYEELGKYLRKKQPDALVGHYYLGKYYEAIGQHKKAMKMYQSGYILSETEGFTKDKMLEKADDIKAEFGY